MWLCTVKEVAGGADRANSVCHVTHFLDAAEPK